MHVQQWVNDGTALNSRSYWKPINREPTLQEMAAARIGADGILYFWHDRGEIHSRVGASVAAQLFQIVEGEADAR